MAGMINAAQKLAVANQIDFSNINMKGDGVAHLSPEGLLLYCSSRLDAVDTTIKQYFDDQQRKNKAMKDATSLMNALNGWNRAYGSKELGDPNTPNRDWHLQDHANKANDILKVWRETEDPQVKAACADAFRTVSGLDINDYAEPGKAVTAAAVKTSAEANAIPGADESLWTKKIDSIKNDQAAMSKSGELNMIQLQSLVSQRQLAIQMTTQLMQTIHESSKQIAGNIRA
jgi:hypothetical protein